MMEVKISDIISSTGLEKDLFENLNKGEEQAERKKEEEDREEEDREGHLRKTKQMCSKPRHKNKTSSKHKQRTKQLFVGCEQAK